MSRTTIVRTCIFCKREYPIIVPIEGYDLWKQGRMIQDAMPGVSAADREFLISGTCGECFDGMFKGVQA